MSDRNSEQKEFAIKRITTPQGDVPTVESVIEGMNLIVKRINALSKNFNERMKYSGASIEASEFIERNLSETNLRIMELKKQLTTNSDQIENINENLMNLDKIVTNLENMTKNIVNEGFAPESRSYEGIIELKNMTKTLQKSVTELQKSLGEADIELIKLYWEHHYTEIEENLVDIPVYDEEKTTILSFFKVLNLPKPIIELDAKILLYGVSGVGKSSLIRAIAKDQKIKIIELNLPLLLSLKSSKQVETLNTFFHYLRFKEGFKSSVLLLDSFDLIKKIQDSPSFLPFMETLIQEINKIHLTKDRILIVAIFNDLDQVNKRFLNLFNEKIELKLPDQISRSLILRRFLNEVNLDIEIDIEDLSSRLSEPSFTKEFTLRDLKEILNIAKLKAFSDGNSLINEKYLKTAIEIIKNRKSSEKVAGKGRTTQKEVDVEKKLLFLQEELNNVKMLLANSTRMLKHALRLALTDNYNFINRLFNHFEMTMKPLTIQEIAQVTGMREEAVLKMVKKMPYRMLFPKIGEQYYVGFDKAMFDELLSELALTL
ncbi:MAG: AAA family ATPase [Candidatus Helarchaeota archaeon]